MPVVKADAYGHGATQVARRLVRAGAGACWPWPTRRRAPSSGRPGSACPSIVLAGFSDGQVALLARERLTPVVSTPAQLEALLAPAAARPAQSCTSRWTRACRGSASRRPAFVEAALRLSDGGLDVDGVMTHLACADESDAETARQLDRFDDGGRRPRGRVACARPSSTPRTAPACRRPGRDTRSRARACSSTGCPRAPSGPDVAVSPVMSVSADIALVKEVPPGTRVSYGGRFTAPRTVAHRDRAVRVRGRRAAHARDVRAGRLRSSGGRRAPVAGTVCMDLTMLDVTDHRGACARETRRCCSATSPTAWDVAELRGDERLAGADRDRPARARACTSKVGDRGRGRAPLRSRRAAA